MARAKWYELTPMRRQLLIALWTAIAIFGFFLARNIESARPVIKSNESKQDVNNLAR
jgi:hypothetical protein